MYPQLNFSLGQMAQMPAATLPDDPECHEEIKVIGRGKKRSF